MSQEKVNRYKEEKRNRQQIMKKERRKSFMLKLGGGVVAIALVGWIGFSAYLQINNPKTGSGSTYAVDTKSLDDFLTDINTTETEAE